MLKNLVCLTWNCPAGVTPVLEFKVLLRYEILSSGYVALEMVERPDTIGLSKNLSAMCKPNQKKKYAQLNVGSRHRKGEGNIENKLKRTRKESYPPNLIGVNDCLLLSLCWHAALMFSTTRLLRTHGIAITKTIGTPKSDICRDRESGEIVKLSTEHTGVKAESIRHTVYVMQILLSELVIERNRSFF